MLRHLAILLLFTSCAATEVQPPVFMVRESQDQAIPNTITESTIKAKESSQSKNSKTKPLDNTDIIEDSDKQVLIDKNEEILLAQITTDYTDKTYDLILTLDENKMVSSIKTKANNGKVKKYPVNVLGRQIVLVKAVGVSLVTLLCKNFKQSVGCPLEIEYPSNITYGKFLKFESNLAFEDNRWQLQSQGRQFRSMHLVAKKIFGILIGVDRIELR